MLVEELDGVDKVITQKYPELPSAYAVQNDAAWRYDDEERLRVRMSMKKLRRRARNMKFNDPSILLRHFADRGCDGRECEHSRENQPSTEVHPGSHRSCRSQQENLLEKASLCEC
ncbi:hypothetical protein PMAYCL1PPCAC_23129 [Pristionchus mayeri]|uniref:Uncharacterized protein n=1 Tax=Pristionchus mayeri TaxID=1317129 RepID=A0AAN5I645_9BILA|nr:hypothetical protein PMAYCL1PPCAC_23128 [Pristionchus mayeri]GMR52934.1 hypothetical protein PMAYCL1PPCAC_23129 [Pristionchus mayeri]